jgi:hypothetical protein
MPIISGQVQNRSRPIPFEFKDQLALVDGRFKLYSSDRGTEFELYDLVEDPGESNDVAERHPQIVAQMRSWLVEWRASCQSSRSGSDYFTKLN